MNLIPITVETYSGYKADEHPKCFYVYTIRIEILEVLDRWYQGESSEWPVSDYFKCETVGGAQYLIKHELKKDQWYLCL